MENVFKKKFLRLGSREDAAQSIHEPQLISSLIVINLSSLTALLISAVFIGTQLFMQIHQTEVRVFSHVGEASAGADDENRNVFSCFYSG